MNLSYILPGRGAAPLLAAARARRATPPVTLLSSIEPHLAGPARWREALKIGLRAARHPGPTRRWLALLNSHPALADQVAQRPSVLLKIYRPYLSATLGVTARLDVLASHYAFLFRHGLAGMLGQAGRAGFLLAHFSGKSGVPYTVQLRAAGTCEREGELVLQLCCAGAVVYAVAFTFSSVGGAARVHIGCLQGGRGPAALDAIKEATRELHGLRAKSLLVGLVQQLGFALGCSELRLVGNANRTAGRAIGRGHVHADYEQLWQELGAWRLPDGDFTLPCQALAPLDEASIAQKRRSEARKRHRLEQALGAAVIARFAAGGRGALALLAA